jgi:uncharacterized protein (DUF1778 family)
MRRRGTLNIRIQPQVLELIDRAARIAGKNRTDFVLEAARRTAGNTLLDRTVISVSPKVYRQLLALPAAGNDPPRPPKNPLAAAIAPAASPAKNHKGRSAAARKAQSQRMKAHWARRGGRRQKKK